MGGLQQSLELLTSPFTPPPKSSFEHHPRVGLFLSQGKGGTTAGFMEKDFKEVLFACSTNPANPAGYQRQGSESTLERPLLKVPDLKRNSQTHDMKRPHPRSLKKLVIC